MDQFIVTDGARIPVSFIDRGFPLIYSSWEWVDRYLRLLGWSYVFRMFPFTIPLFFAYPVDPGAVLLPLMALSPFYAYISYDTYRSLRMVQRGLASPGIYALGVELPMAPFYSRRYFIPWDSIEGLHVSRAGFLLRLVVNLKVGGSKLPWTFPMSLLGRSELITLRALLEDMRLPDSLGLTSQVPEMVIYGASGRERMRNS